MPTQADRPPEGYHLQKCEGWGIATLMPDDWHFWYTVQGCFMSRERLWYGSRVGYLTGLSIAAFADMHEDGSWSHDKIAKKFVEQPPEDSLVPTSGVERIETPSLVTYLRTFEHPGGIIAGIMKGPISLYLAGIVHEETDRLYVAKFETLTQNWATFRDVGRMMIEGIRTTTP